MLNKDRWTLGIVIGLVLPMLVYALALLILKQYGHVEGLVYLPRPRVPGLIGVASNLFPFRFFMVNKKFDRTGRGILVVTFVMTLLVFYFF
ncbi:MAG: hypothetical protein ACLFN2_01620 [Bacteroidales bacterium]